MDVTQHSSFLNVGSSTDHKQLGPLSGLLWVVPPRTGNTGVCCTCSFLFIWMCTSFIWYPRNLPLYLHNTQMCPFSPTPPLRPWLLALLSPITNIPMSVPINLCVCFNVCTSVPYCLDYCQFGVYFKVSPDGAINFSFPFSREPWQFKIFLWPHRNFRVVRNIPLKFC